MTFQMYLLEEKIEAEARGRNEERESLACKLIRSGRPLQEIHEDTGLSLPRLQQLTQSNEHNFSTQE